MDAQQKENGSARLTLDLTDFAAQQALKHYLALHGVSHLSNPDECDSDDLTMLRSAFEASAEDMLLVVSDGEMAELLTRDGGYVAELEEDAIGRDALLRECLDDLPQGHAPGLWVWRGRVTMENQGRGFEDLYDEWASVWNGEWTRATRADLDLLMFAPEQWVAAESEIDDVKVVAALRAQFPDGRFHERINGGCE